MSQQQQDNPFGKNAGELPDYSEEAIVAPARDSWLKDPRKKKFIQRGLIFLLLLLLSVPAYKQVKDWRARSLMQKSGVAFALGDSQKGLNLLKQALALAPGSDAIQHAVELYNARSGDAESLNKVIQRMMSGGSDNEEILGIAEIAAMKGRKDLIREALSRLPKDSLKWNFLRRSLLEASLKAQEENPLAAAEFCIGRAVTAPSRDDAGYLRLQAALDLYASKDVSQNPRILELLQGVVTDRNKASLTAWRILGQILISPPEGFVVPDEVAEASRLASILPSLPGSIPKDELMAADLAIKGNPDIKESIAEKLISHRRLSPRADQMDLARWLNGHGLQKKVIEMAGTDKPATDTDWLLIVLDAKTSTGDLDDIPRMLNSPSASGIQEAVRHLYLAKVAMMKGDQMMADAEWSNVGASLRLEKPEILAYIAGYEEKIGVMDRAAQTYGEMANREETKVQGLVGLIRCQPIDASAKRLIPLYERLLATVSDNQDAQCDLAYLNLLAKEDIALSAAVAEKLYASQPNAMTRISTVALGRLRSGDSKGAMDVYRDKVIDWKTTPAPWKCVRCAVLRANGATSEADMMESSIDSKMLRPEERELLASSRKDPK